MCAEIRLYSGESVFNEIVKQTDYLKLKNGNISEVHHILWNSLFIAKSIESKNISIARGLIKCLHEYLYRGFLIPRINMSISKRYNEDVPKVYRCTLYIPNIIDIVYGKTYNDYHDDPMWKGFQSAVFVQSAHVQAMCHILLTEIVKDERYTNDRIKKLCVELRKILDYVTKTEANHKTTSEEHLEKWDEVSLRYKKEMNSLTDKVLDVFYEYHESKEHPDPLVASICCTIIHFAKLYKSLFEFTIKGLLIKYEADASSYVKEFVDMWEQTLRILTACNKHLGVKIYQHGDIPIPKGLDNLSVSITSKINEDELWDRLTDNL